MARESNIAYQTIDMVHITNPAEFAMYCISELSKRKPRAWFIDLVCNAKQMPKALQLQELLRKELEARHPWQRFGGDTVVIRINLEYAHELKAKQAMEAIINSHRKSGFVQDVKYLAPDGTELPIEY